MFKNKRQRRAFMVGAIFLLIVLGIFILSVLSKDEENPGIQTTTLPEKYQNLPKMPIPVLPEADNNNQILINVAVEDAQIPSEANIYELEQKPYTEAEVMDLAKKFGITSKPQKANDAITGENYFFTSGDILIVTANHRSFDFKTNKLTSVIDKTVPQSQFEAAARAYLSSRNIVDLSKFEIESVRYLSNKDYELEDNDDARTIMFTYTQKHEGQRIFSRSYNLGLVSVTVNANRQITRITATELPTLIKKEAYPLIDLKTIKLIAQKEAIIQSVDDGKISGLDVSPRNISKIVITGIEIGYALEQKVDQRYLQPVFHLKGTATLREDNKEVTATLFLPALHREVITTEN